MATAPDLSILLVHGEEDDPSEKNEKKEGKPEKTPEESPDQVVDSVTGYRSELGLQLDDDTAF